MSHQFVRSVNYQKGNATIKDWYKSIASSPAFRGGSKIQTTNPDGSPGAIVPRNGAVILFGDRTVLQPAKQQEQSAFVSMKPLAIMTADDAIVRSFNGQPVLDSHSGSVFAMPLADLKEFPELANYVSEQTAQIATGTRGDHEFSPPNMLVGALGCLQGTVFNMSKDMVLNKPTSNPGKIAFYVTAFRETAFFIQNLAGYSEEIRKILEALTLHASPMDVLSSILAMFIADKVPSEDIRKHWVFHILNRHFKRHPGSRLTDRDHQSPGLIACLLVIPTLASQLSAGIDNIDKIFAQVVQTLNKATRSILDQLRGTSDMDVDEENKTVLSALAEASPVKLINTNHLPSLYDMVMTGDSLGISNMPFFVADQHVLISGKYPRTIPIQTQPSPGIFEGVFVSSDLKDWTAFALKSGAYIFWCQLQASSKSKKGDTRNDTENANFRVTAGRDGQPLEGMRGNYVGVSTSGMLYNPEASRRNRFSQLPDSVKFTMEKMIHVDCTKKGIVVTQERQKICEIPPKRGEDGRDLIPIVAFKYCSVRIEQIRPGIDLEEESKDDEEVKISEDSSPSKVLSLSDEVHRLKFARAQSVNPFKDTSASNLLK